MPRNDNLSMNKTYYRKNCDEHVEMDEWNKEDREDEERRNKSKCRVANICEQIREERLRWLEHVERKF